MMASQDFDPDFDYVLKTKEQNRICFGSTQDRVLGKYTNMRNVPELFSSSPVAYNPASGISEVLKKHVSRKGYGSLCSGTPRFARQDKDEFPSPTRYYIETDRKLKPSIYPFDTNTSRMKRKIDKNPGPGTYVIKGKRSHGVNVAGCFGGKQVRADAVEIICVPIPIDTCEFCREVCEGDYWHKNHSIYLCLSCMKDERKNFTRFKRRELREFRRIRNCSFMHRHEGTTAAVRLIPYSQVVRKLRVENYIDLFYGSDLDFPEMELRRPPLSEYKEKLQNCIDLIRKGGKY